MGRKSFTEINRSFKVMSVACRSLTVFHYVTADERVSLLLKLLEFITHPLNAGCSKGADTLERLHSLYHEVYRALAGQSWEDVVLELLLSRENRLTELACGDKEQLREITLADASRDLAVLRHLTQVSAEDVRSLAALHLTESRESIFADPLLSESWPLWREEALPMPKVAARSLMFLAEQCEALYSEFRAQEDWRGLAVRLLDFYRQGGWGVFCHTVFRVLPDGTLAGTTNPDPVEITGLYSQEREQGIILQNTEFFLQGHAANNIILYGNRGTGKSSLVKALPNAYAARGLRLIQLRRDDIRHFEALCGTLAGLPWFFIIFIDDLTFEDAEGEFREMKTLLEGSVAAKPRNVLVYATSNRKNLVRENFAERQGGEVHAQDGMEEKLSLADRFGITVTFLTPDQDTFIKIVSGLAADRGLALPAEELKKKALQWAGQHNARSGRSAQQFIDFLGAELAVR